MCVVKMYRYVIKIWGCSIYFQSMYHSILCIIICFKVTKYVLLIDIL